MKLYLFGGGRIKCENYSVFKKLLKLALIADNPKNILHIPYARLISDDKQWEEGWLKELMNDTGIEILDARVQKDRERFDGKVVFINGGHGKIELLKVIKSDRELLKIIQNAECVIAESSSARVLGEKLRINRHGEGEDIVDGIGLLKGVIIESHYSCRQSEQLLKDELVRSKMKYGLGIDSETAIVVRPEDFPRHFKKIGDGNVFIMSKKKDIVFIDNF